MIKIRLRKLTPIGLQLKEYLEHSVLVCSEEERRAELDSLRQDWKDCVRCPLGPLARHHVVTGDIIPFNVPREAMTVKADVLIIGEGPGESEDVLGRPFVGVAGKLLKEAIWEAEPDGLMIAFNNLVSCRPQDRRNGNNREPEPEEAAECRPRLERLIQILNPLTIIAAGSIPKYFLPPMMFESGWSGRFRSILHPSYVLRAGGKRYLNYPKYVAELREIFEITRKDKEST